MAQRGRILPWVPVVLWIAVVLGLGSNPFQHDETSRILGPLLRWLFPDWAPDRIAAAHALLRKSAHVFEYAVAAVLTWNALFRTLPRSSRTRLAFGTLALVLLVAAGDELRQTTLPDRTGSPADVALDLAGGVAGLLVAPLLLGPRPAGPRKGGLGSAGARDGASRSAGLRDG